MGATWTATFESVTPLAGSITDTLQVDQIVALSQFANLSAVGMVEGSTFTSLPDKSTQLYLVGWDANQQALTFSAAASVTTSW